MKIVNLDQVPKLEVNIEGAKNTYKQTPISKSDGSSLVSFRVFTIEPGGHTPFHTHPFEHLNYVISGHGSIVSENGDHKLKKGDFAFMPSGQKHQYRNDADDKDLVMICAVQKEYE